MKPDKRVEALATVKRVGELFGIAAEQMVQAQVGREEMASIRFDALLRKIEDRIGKDEQLGLF